MMDIFDYILSNLIYESSLPPLQRKFETIWKKKELGDGLDSSRDIRHEFWLLSNGRILDVSRHKDAPEMLGVSWNRWMKTGVIRGIITAAGSLSINFYKDVIITPEQRRIILEIFRYQKLSRLFLDIDISADTTYEQIVLDQRDFSGRGSFMAKVRKILEGLGS